VSEEWNQICKPPSNFRKYFWGPALFRLVLLYNPTCDRCKQAFETASRVLCDCEALTALRVRHLGQHFLKPSDFDDISVNRVFVLCSNCGAAICMSCTKLRSRSKGSLWCPPICIAFLGSRMHTGPSRWRMCGVLTCATVDADVTYFRDRRSSLNNKWLCAAKWEWRETIVSQSSYCSWAITVNICDVLRVNLVVQG
jgi:hypothetical protein